MTTPAVGQFTTVRTEADYIDGPACKLFVTCFRPQVQANSHRAVLCLPPFAEEMNKSRRMLALQGRALAQRGILFVLPDIRGTGDSEQEFGDVQWDTWCHDIRSVTRWIESRGVNRIDLLAVRSGVFLGLELLAKMTCRIVLWSPVIRGSTMLDQLFRTILVRNLGRKKSTSVAEIREELARAGGMEVAGYWISDDLLRGIDGLDMKNVELATGSRVLWADVSPAISEGVPRRAEKLLGDWDSRNIRTKYARCTGPQFWSGPEIEVVPELLEKTTTFLADY